MNEESPNPPLAQSPWLGWRAGGALGLLVLLVYLPSFRGGFVWDDALLIEQNPLVKGDFNLRSIWFSTDFPLSNIALWLEWLTFGKSAMGYRIVNALLHATSCVLLWRLLRRLQIPGAWLGAALFAVHPVAVGSVAWISEIKNILSLPFCLLSFLWFLDCEEHRATATGAKPALTFALSLVAFVLALLTKTTVVVLPVLLLLTLWWKHKALVARDLFRTMPHFVLALGFGLLTVWFQKHQTLASFPMPSEGWATRLAAAGMAVWFYLGTALWPSNLCAIYPRWEIDPAQARNFLPLILLVTILVLGWWKRPTWGRHLVFGFGCFCACLFPALGFFDMYFLVFSRVSDHFQYLALIAPLTSIAAGLSLLRRTYWQHCLAILLLLGMGGLGWQRASVFAADETLWRDTLAKNPAAWNAHNNLGCLLAEKGDLAGATTEFEASIKINPGNASAHCNLAKAWLLKNNFAEAEKHFRAALESQPNHLDSLRSYAAALAEHGRLTEAVTRMREALRLKPSAELRLQFAPWLSALGRDREAVAELRLAVAARPDFTEALSALAWILATSGDESVRTGAEALQLAERARQLKPEGDAQLFTALAAALAETGRYVEAVNAAQQAVRLAETSGETRLIKLNAQLARLYQAGKAYHSKPAIKN